MAGIGAVEWTTFQPVGNRLKQMQSETGNRELEHRPLSKTDSELQ